MNLETLGILDLVEVLTLGLYEMPYLAKVKSFIVVNIRTTYLQAATPSNGSPCLIRKTPSRAGTELL